MMAERQVLAWLLIRRMMRFEAQGGLGKTEVRIFF
jgi:hypothetical protein